jgi:hypothetical protein
MYSFFKKFKKTININTINIAIVACNIEVIYRSVLLLKITMSIGAIKITKKADITKSVIQITPISKNRLDILNFSTQDKIILNNN